MYDTDKPDHVCHIDCKLIEREDGGRSHIMYASEPNTAAGRYQYDSNREILTMGRGARKAMRATGQQDTRNNREWNYGRKLFKDATQRIRSGASAVTSDRIYREEANHAFGPDRRPFVKRSIRSLARFRKFSSQAGLASIMRPAYLAGSEHDPNL